MANQNVFSWLPGIPVQIPILICLLFSLLKYDGHINKLSLYALASVILYLPSALLSDYLLISGFKLINFAACLIGICLVFGDKEVILRSDSLIKVFRFITFITMFIYLLKLGYTRNETGFSGVFSHPQVGGTFYALCFIYEVFWRRVNKSVKRYSTWISWVFIGLNIFFTLQSESRTAFISALLVMILFIVWSLTSSTFNLTYYHLITIACVFFISLFYIDTILNYLDYVLSKSGRVEGGVISSLESSRGALVASSLQNFICNPIFGIGFQVSNGLFGSYPMEINYWNGLPVGASVEKGVFYSGLLEEVGLVGLLGFILFFFIYFIKYLNSYFISTLIVLFALFSNFGEATLFSFGGNGLFIWLIIIVISRTLNIRNNKV